MASIMGPDFIALQVSDLERSKKFYTDIVGLKLAPQSPPDAVLFITNPIPFAIRKPHPGIDLKAALLLGHGVALWFLCDDSIQLCRSLREKGVVVLDEPTPGPFGMTFHFKDVDGYILTVHDKA